MLLDLLPLTTEATNSLDGDPVVALVGIVNGSESVEPWTQVVDGFGSVKPWIQDVDWSGSVGPSGRMIRLDDFKSVFC